MPLVLITILVSIAGLVLFCLVHAMAPINITLETVPAAGCRDTKMAKPCANILNGLALYGSFWTILAAVAVASIVAARSSLKLNFSAKFQNWMYGTFAVATVLFTASFVQETFPYWRIAGRIFTNTVSAFGHGAWFKPSLHVANFLTAAGAIAIAVACVSQPYRECDAEADTEWGPHYGSTMASLRNLVTLGALLLVVGIMFLSTWLAIPVALIPAEEQAKTYRSLIDAIVTLHGAAYSAALFILYFVSASRIQKKALTEQLKINKQTDKEAYLKKYSLTLAPPAYLLDAIKVVAPLLTAKLFEPLAKYFSTL
ncbi:hypothetical protein [Roseomonas sp. BN140053]|uniref:hypothetical protein n=1 Tax=Roseomonas sp. BN140053 TaxID=3391898 RepID=UPI0039E854B1